MRALASLTFHALGLATLGLALAGCPAPPDPGPYPLEAPPIDADRVSLDDALGWPVQRETVADLDGDGADEHLVLAADATAGPDGDPLWEDGHRWALWAVELAPDSVRTLLYGAFVSQGRVEIALEDPSIGGAPDVVVMERTPSQVRMLEVRYHAPGDARTVTAAYYHPRTWLTIP